MFIFSTPVLIRHLWQLKTVVFLHWCLICTVQLITSTWLSLRDRLASPANIKLRWERSARTNTLAYSSQTKKNRFIISKPVQLGPVSATSMHFLMTSPTQLTNVVTSLVGRRENGVTPPRNHGNAKKSGVTTSMGDATQLLSGVTSQTEAARDVTSLTEAVTSQKSAGVTRWRRRSRWADLRRCVRTGASFQRSRNRNPSRLTFSSSHFRSRVPVASSPSRNLQTKQFLLF